MVEDMLRFFVAVKELEEEGLPPQIRPKWVEARQIMKLIIVTALNSNFVNLRG